MLRQLLVKRSLYNSRSSFTSSFRRLFSTSLSPAENLPLKTPFAVQYLVESCGLPKEKALKASKYISHLKSPAKPDSVLEFLRQIGLDDAGIRKAITYDPNILCANPEKTLKPRLMKIQEMGFSPSQVARLFPLTPIIFRSKYNSLQRQIEFLTPFLGSLEGILTALKRAPYLLTVNLEKVIKPNISFLQKHCGLSPSQIGKIIARMPSVFTFNPNKLKAAAHRAEELASSRGSGIFISLLQVTTCYSPSSLDAKMENFKKIGFSEKEIDSLIKKQPMLLACIGERTRIIIEFLTSEAGLDLQYIARHPDLISYSLERRIIPRHYVLKSLQSKGLCEHFNLSSVMKLTEEKFANKFVKPYENIIPEVFEAYEAARTGKISLKGKL